VTKDVSDLRVRVRYAWFVLRGHPVEFGIKPQGGTTSHVDRSWWLVLPRSAFGRRDAPPPVQCQICDCGVLDITKHAEWHEAQAR
jgi:hypothetical protein